MRNLALTTLDEEIVAEDVTAAQAPGGGRSRGFLCSPLLDQPLREARDAFEKLYFEHHLRLEGGNMTGWPNKSGWSVPPVSQAEASSGWPWAENAEE